MLTGGCYCGAIRYEASEDASNQTNCHCDMCRGTTGAPCVAWFTVPAVDFRIIAGEPARFRSSSHAIRSFCSTCGTQLTFSDDAALDEMDVTTCSLDDPNRLPPRDHTFTASQLAWLKLADGLPRYRRTRAEG